MPNLSFGSGGSGNSFQRLTCHTSARFRVRAPGPVSGQLYETASGGLALIRLAFLPPFGRRHSLLGHPVPARELGPPCGRLTGPPQSAPDPDGVSVFHTHEKRRGWVSSVPRRRRCPHGQAMSLTAACRVATACPCLPGITTRPGESQLRGISKASLSFTPYPAFPSPVIPRRNGNPWAFPLSFTPDRARPGRACQGRDEP